MYLGLAMLFRYRAWVDGHEATLSVWGMENDEAIMFQAIHRGYQKHTSPPPRALLSRQE